MFSTAHLASGVAVALALGLEGAPLWAFVLASVLTDWDYVFQVLDARRRRREAARLDPRLRPAVATGRNHRTLLTHSPPVYVAILGPLGLWQPIAWWGLAGSLLHFSLDVWEYGLRLNPFQDKIYGFRLLPGVEDMRFAEYLRTYFSDKRFLGAEIAFAGAAIVLVALRLT